MLFSHPPLLITTNLLILFWLNPAPLVNCQGGTCEIMSMEDVGAVQGTVCSNPDAIAYFDRCCVDPTTPSPSTPSSIDSSTPSSPSTTTTTPTTPKMTCQQLGMVDIGPSLLDACDGDAKAYSGRCCLQQPSTSTSTSTSTTTTTTTTTPTTTTTTTPTTPTTTASTTTVSSSTAAPLSLYRNGVFVMKCIDVDPTPTCLKKILSCVTNKVQMAYTCCGSCYAVFPNFLPKAKGVCKDNYPDACSFWGSSKCSTSTTFGQKMMEECKQTCKNCPK